jgi:hypothetical protein
VRFRLQEAVHVSGSISTQLLLSLQLHHAVLSFLLLYGVHITQALCNSGVVYRELDRLEEAVAAYEDALAVSVHLRQMAAELGPALR